MIPERELWVCVILQAIDDLTGITDVSPHVIVRSEAWKPRIGFSPKLNPWDPSCGSAVNLNLETTMSPFHAPFETILNNLNNPSK